MPLVDDYYVWRCNNCNKVEKYKFGTREFVASTYAWNMIELRVDNNFNEIVLCPDCCKKLLNGYNLVERGNIDSIFRVGNYVRSLNALTKTCIDHGGDLGGPYFTRKDQTLEAAKTMIDVCGMANVDVKIENGYLKYSFKED